MDRTERFYRIERLLRNRRSVRFEDLLKELEVSRATLKRDLQYMRDRLHSPIFWDAELRGYRIEREGEASSLPGFWLSPKEVQALLMLEHLIRSIEPSLLAQSLEPIREHLERLIGDRPSQMRELRRRVKLFQTFRRTVAPPFFTLVGHALLTRKKLQLLHWSREWDEDVERKVSPQRLTYYRGAWYLDAWCETRKALRSFGLDAIKGATIVEQKAIDMPDVELDAFYSVGYGIFGGTEVRIAKIRFSPKSARWVSREEWHPSQSGAFDVNGCYVLEVPFSDPRELMMDVLRHGPEAEVLAPDSLRKSVANLLSKAEMQYRICPGKLPSDDLSLKPGTTTAVRTRLRRTSPSFRRR